jgi:hypothetical protein
MSFINLTRAAIPNPIVIPINTMVVIIYAVSAVKVLGIALKSKGNIDNKVKTTAMPNKFKTIKLGSLSKYLSKIIKIIWATIDKISIVVRIGSHKLKSSVRMGYLFHVVTPATGSG